MANKVQKLTLTGNEICEILRCCLETGAISFTLGEMNVVFKGGVTAKPVMPVNCDRVIVPDRELSSLTKEEEYELKMERLLIDNPTAYEELMQKEVSDGE